MAPSKASFNNAIVLVQAQHLDGFPLDGFKHTDWIYCFSGMPLIRAGKLKYTVVDYINENQYFVEPKLIKLFWLQTGDFVILNPSVETEADKAKFTIVSWDDKEKCWVYNFSYRDTDGTLRTLGIDNYPILRQCKVI